MSKATVSVWFGLIIVHAYVGRTVIMVVTDIIDGVDDGVGAVVTLGNTSAVIGTVNLCNVFSVQQQQQRLNSSSRGGINTLSFQ